jgi:DNA modification methylase
MGSGTSAIAALNCELDYIGFDIDADYKAFAEDRIAEHELNTFALHFEVDAES